MRYVGARIETIAHRDREADPAPPSRDDGDVPLEEAGAKHARHDWAGTLAACGGAIQLTRLQASPARSRRRGGARAGDSPARTAPRLAMPVVRK